MITFQDMTRKSESIMPLSEDFKEISKLMLHQETILKKQKELDEVISNKNEENSRLKDHNQKLLA